PPTQRPWRRDQARGPIGICRQIRRASWLRAKPPAAVYYCEGKMSIAWYRRLPVAPGIRLVIVVLRRQQAERVALELKPFVSDVNKLARSRPRGRWSGGARPRRTCRRLSVCRSRDGRTRCTIERRAWSDPRTATTD